SAEDGCTWQGTRGDAFEIAKTVLKRCQEDPVLSEALPDALELLTHATIEALSLAEQRAVAKVPVPVSGPAPRATSHSRPRRDRGTGEDGGVVVVEEKEEEAERRGCSPAASCGEW
ncbi:unnamed protein product, partial [Discosporangium mesarthrocarpum]